MSTVPTHEPDPEGLQTDEELTPALLFIVHRRLRATIIVPVGFSAIEAPQAGTIEPIVAQVALDRDAQSVGDGVQRQAPKFFDS